MSVESSSRAGDSSMGAPALEIFEDAQFAKSETAGICFASSDIVPLALISRAPLLKIISTSRFDLGTLDPLDLGNNNQNAILSVRHSFFRLFIDTDFGRPPVNPPLGFRCFWARVVDCCRGEHALHL